MLKTVERYAGRPIGSYLGSTSRTQARYELLQNDLVAVWIIVRIGNHAELNSSLSFALPFEPSFEHISHWSAGIACVDLSKKETYYGVGFITPNQPMRITNFLLDDGTPISDYHPFKWSTFDRLELFTLYQRTTSAS